ncbi:CocE/NonD family hydrolase [Actinomadura montaniterrae]|nr:CocE/NonD family hydrolase [Actinomadura montaniterrae]
MNRLGSITLAAASATALTCVLGAMPIAEAAPAKASIRPQAKAPSGPDAWANYTVPKPSYPREARTVDVEIPMDDGVVLRADVTRPALADGSPAPGRFPVVVVQGCYGKPVALLTDSDYARYGYVEVIVDVRGTGNSDGSFRALDSRERKDSYEIVQWAAKQPWSTGKVGAAGFSYYGASANRTAEIAPPALKAVVAGASPVDIYREFMADGGHWASPSFLWFLLELTGTLPSPSLDDPAKALEILRKRLAADGNGIPWRFDQLIKLFNGQNNWDNADWRERSLDVTKIKAATLVYTGWEDLFFRSSPRQYRDMKLQPGRKQLVIGPWTHYTLNKSVKPEETPSPTKMQLAVAWFDHWLKGRNNGIDKVGPVTLYDQGADRWTQYKDWPSTATDYRRLYLNGTKSGTATSLNDGTLAAAPPTTGGADTGQFNLLGGLCSRSTTQFLGGAIPEGVPCNTDNRPEEKHSFTYTTQPFTTATQIAGSVGLTLRGSSTAKDASWVGRLSDVAPDGHSTPMTQGVLLTSRRSYDPAKTVYAANGDPIEPYHYYTPDRAQPVSPGQQATMHIEILATDWILKPGHRLRLTVSGSDTPHIMPSLQSPERFGIATVHRDPSNPSYLTVPLRAVTN